MNITMQNIERLTLEQIREFVEGSRTIGFAAPKREAVYEFLERVLKSQQYRRLSRGQKGIVRRFLVKMTGLSRAQLTRWIGRCMKTRRVQRKPACRPSLLRCGHCGAKLLAQYPGPRVIRYQCSGYLQNRDRACCVMFGGLRAGKSLSRISDSELARRQTADS